jgi:aldehyde dehydrogenase (NAD+)
MNVIINEKHFSRLVGSLAIRKAVVGGGTDVETVYEPTLWTRWICSRPSCRRDFGRYCPCCRIPDIRECIGYITAPPRPLSLYLFTASPPERLLRELSFGGGCINDTIIHVASSLMPFGGVGASGMGSYHGKKSFDTFTHCRSMLKKATWLDLPIRYRPYSPGRDKLVRMFLK